MKSSASAPSYQIGGIFQAEENPIADMVSF